MSSCGSCTLCCKLMAIEELSKPVGVWCQHCDVGVGCKIYDTRPESCQTFRCLWLDQDHWPEELRPDQSGVVLFVPEMRPDQIQGKCDPHRPLAWDRGPMKKLLDAATNEGFDILLTIGSKRKFLTTNPQRAEEVKELIDRGGGAGWRPVTKLS